MITWNIAFVNATAGNKNVYKGNPAPPEALSWHFPGGEERLRLPYLVNFTHLVRRTPEAGNRIRHLHWGLDYHVEAAGLFSLDGRTWRPREAETAHLYAPGTFYWEKSRASDLPFTETYMLFVTDKEPALDALVAPGKGFARFRDESGALGAVFRRLMKADANGNRLWTAQGGLLELLDRLLAARYAENGEYRIAEGPAPTDSLAARVEACIRAGYDQPLTLNEMARAAGVSRSTLTHRYAEETGSTPFDRLSEYRLDVARGLLLKGERAKEIAMRTGFYDEFHFAKAFKRRFGLPPRRYARTFLSGQV